jgi:hypothetical protein
MAYNWFSPYYFASLASSDFPSGATVPFIMFHGAADTEVNVQQSCELATELSATTYYVSSTSGAVGPCSGSIPQVASPSGCVSATTPRQCDAITTTGTHDLIVYQGAGHTSILKMAYKQFFAWVGNLGWKTPAGYDVVTPNSGMLLVPPDTSSP